MSTIVLEPYFFDQYPKVSYNSAMLGPIILKLKKLNSLFLIKICIKIFFFLIFLGVFDHVDHEYELCFGQISVGWAWHSIFGELDILANEGILKLMINSKYHFNSKTAEDLTWLSYKTLSGIGQKNKVQGRLWTQKIELVETKSNIWKKRFKNVFVLRNWSQNKKDNKIKFFLDYPTLKIHKRIFK
ncbi:hypothetical protein BpHYR1_021953 [Brachionus plicatilis]|uniref:Uncharacterized protein n=1 Tax=Brachionus plicatilis TaxID=10195 RepID=A0A3M7PCU9_BRAPC|nr:hypothetical protein BpHYR1_021953 [Brachionus plicatilis]